MCVRASGTTTACRVSSSAWAGASACGIGSSRLVSGVSVRPPPCRQSPATGSCCRSSGVTSIGISAADGVHSCGVGSDTACSAPAFSTRHHVGRHLVDNLPCIFRPRRRGLLARGQSRSTVDDRCDGSSYDGSTTARWHLATVPPRQLEPRRSGSGQRPARLGDRRLSTTGQVPAIDVWSAIDHVSRDRCQRLRRRLAGLGDRRLVGDRPCLNDCRVISRRRRLDDRRFDQPPAHVCAIGCLVSAAATSRRSACWSATGHVSAIGAWSATGHISAIGAVSDRHVSTIGRSPAATSRRSADVRRGAVCSTGGTGSTSASAATRPARQPSYPRRQGRRR